jgi:hypothetical protein
VKGITPEGERLYGPMIDAVRSETVRIEQERGLPARAVAELIGTALTSSRPRARYVVGKAARSRAVASRVLPDRVMDRLIGRALGG